MKKFLTFALCIAAVGSLGAQNEQLKEAKKLSGNIDKIQEARTLVKGALADPNMKNNVEPYFIAGKIEFDAFEEAMKKKAVNPKDPKVDPIAMAEQLLNGYDYYLKALPLDSLPNAKGKVDPKNSKKIFATIRRHKNDYYDAGANFFNAKRYYPEAYRAFMIYGDINNFPQYAGDKEIAIDSLNGQAYFYAGRAAYSGSKVDEAIKAFDKARKVGLDDPDLYTYDIACWQYIAQKDTNRIQEAQNQIFKISQEGYKNFGVKQPLFINNMAVVMSQQGKGLEAIELLSKEISANPDNAGLYGLRGYLYDRIKDTDKSVADYRKAASLPTADFETLLNAGKKIFRTGTEKWNLIEGNSEKARAERQDVKTNYFEAAKAIADKAKAVKPGDSGLNRLLESIDYALTTFFPQTAQ